MMDQDIEKEASRSRDSRAESDEQQFEPIHTRTDRHTRPPSRASSTAQTISRTRSQNGYGVEDEPEEKDDEKQSPPPGQDGKDPFEVGWDGGDNDPMCPRSFNKARKWLIVLIVANASLCV